MGLLLLVSKTNLHIGIVKQMNLGTIASNRIAKGSIGIKGVCEV